MDAHTEARQLWLRGLQKPQAKCYERNPDGSPVMQYTPAAQMQPDYLRRKFASLTSTKGVS